MNENLELTPAVVARIQLVRAYILRMRNERQGWGDDSDAAATAFSFVNALGTLLSAKEVWIDAGCPCCDDNPGNFSFGGYMIEGLPFGMIARKGEPSLAQFTSPPIEWTFHS